MKTPMQEFIDKITLKKVEGQIYLNPILSNSEIKEMLEREYEVMAKVYYDGFINSDGVKLKFNFEEYYNKTFNTKER